MTWALGSDFALTVPGALLRRKGACLTPGAQELGFMYSRAFADLDGHIWEFVWMDPSFIQPQ